MVANPQFTDFQGNRPRGILGGNASGNAGCGAPLAALATLCRTRGVLTNLGRLPANRPRTSAPRTLRPTPPGRHRSAARPSRSALELDRPILNNYTVSEWNARA